MATCNTSGSSLGQQISAIREFNRFYTARLGLLRKHHLGGEFSLTEARILYEISARPAITASALRSTLELDAGYISRLIAALTRRRLVRQTPSKLDGREKHLALTAAGERAVAALNRQSDAQLEQMLAHVEPAERDAIVASLHRVRSILGRTEVPAIRIERLTAVRDEALDIVEEYYEAVHVVRRDSAESMQRMLEEPGSGMWLAYRGDEAVGCVVLRKLASLPLAAECKRLYVKPSARGMRIADRLLDVLEEFARSQGFEWIYLDTYDDLKAAIALYERRGYQCCERYNDNPQATLFMRKRIG